MGPICRSLCLLLLTLVAVSGLGRAALASTGGDIFKDCKGYPAAGRKVLCETYVQELVNFAKSTDKLVNPKGVICPGPNVSLADFVASINRWLAAHPELHAKSSYDAAHAALARDYPCR